MWRTEWRYRQIPDRHHDGKFDVVIVGAGPAGIAAACICAEGGKRVALVDQAFRAGGQIWRHRSAEQLPSLARRWIGRLGKVRVTTFYEHSVVAVDDARILTLVRGNVVERIRATSLVLATGARELFLPFPGWTLPWVVGAGGAQALLKEGTSFAGKRVVVSGSGPLLLAVAATLAKGGAKVLHVLEQASMGSIAGFSRALLADPARLVQALGYGATIGIQRYHTGAWVEAAHGAWRLEAVTARMGGMSRSIDCDVLCTGFGLIPSVELARMAGCSIVNDAVQVDAGQLTSSPNVWCVGEAAGVAGVENAVAQGSNAAYTILGKRVPSRIAREVRRGRGITAGLAATFKLRGEVLELPDGDTIVCRCEDVKQKSVDPSWGWRELKLRTRIGMGPCQGRICGGAMRARYGFGPTDARAPVFPAPVSALLDEAKGLQG